MKRENFIELSLNNYDNKGYNRTKCDTTLFT